MKIIELRILALLELHTEQLSNAQIESEFSRIAANIC